MTKFIDHHLLALYSCVNASIELLQTQPETDVVVEMRNLLDAAFDIIDCISNCRHFGSDNLDMIIRDSDKILMQIQELETKSNNND